MKVRQKHSESFPELMTEYGKAKRHSVEERSKTDVCVFLVFSTQIFQGNGNGSKWIANERVINAMGQEWQVCKLS